MSNVVVKRNYRLYYLIIFIIIFSGFLTNFFSIGSIDTGKYLCDGMAVLVTFVNLYLFSNKVTVTKSQESFIIIFFSYILFTILTAIISYTSRFEFMVGLRDHILYYLFFWNIYLIFQIYPGNIMKIYKFILSCMYIDCIFAIFQYIFSAELPSNFLSLKDVTTFSIFGVSSYRVTGLIGDMLSFGSFATMTMILLVCWILYTSGSIIRWLLLLVPLVACVLTYSRISLVMFFTLLLLIILTSSNYNINKKIIIFFSILFLTILFFNFTELGRNILVRFTDYEINQNSNNTHFNSYGEALSQLSSIKNFFFGLGFGTQISSSLGGRIITDGYWWECLLDLGVPAFLCLFLFIILAINSSRKKAKYSSYSVEKMICYAFCFSAINFVVVSFLNSSFDSRINVLLLMFLLSLSMSVGNREIE